MTYCIINKIDMYIVWQNNKAVKLQHCGAAYSLLENISDMLHSTSILLAYSIVSLALMGPFVELSILSYMKSKMTEGILVNYTKKQPVASEKHFQIFFFFLVMYGFLKLFDCSLPKAL